MFRIRHYWAHILLAAFAIGFALYAVLLPRDWGRTPKPPETAPLVKPPEESGLPSYPDNPETERAYAHGLGDGIRQMRERFHLSFENAPQMPRCDD